MIWMSFGRKLSWIKLVKNIHILLKCKFKIIYFSSFKRIVVKLYQIINLKIDPNNYKILGYLYRNIGIFGLKLGIFSKVNLDII